MFVATDISESGKRNDLRKNEGAKGKANVQKERSEMFGYFSVPFLIPVEIPISGASANHEPGFFQNQEKERNLYIPYK